MPYAQNPQFTGREDVLEQLEAALQNNSVALIQPQAISGLGGIGKTQTVLEYLYSHRKHYNAVFWVNSDLREELIADFVSVAKVLQLPIAEAQDQILVINAVKEWFKTHEGWLLILDNADDLKVIQEFLPSGGKGHVLLTTRASATGQIAQAVKLKKMSHLEGALFLLRRAKIIAAKAVWETATDADQQVALEIAKEMDGLPLALDQAGAFVEELSLNLREYLNLYRQEGAKLLAERGELALDHLSVIVTFRLAFNKVLERSPAAADLLRVCTFLASDNIPEEIFTLGASVFMEPLGSTAANALTFAKAVGEAGRLSLIERNSKTQTLNMHRLVQEVLRDEMEPAIRHNWLEQTIKAVNQAFPNHEFEHWPLCEKLLLHVIILSRVKNIDCHNLAALENLFKRTGLYLRERGQYIMADTFLSRSLSICEQLFGRNSPEVAGRMSDLAALHGSQGRYKEAELLLVKSLNVLEEQSEPSDYSAVTNNLAEIYRIQGRHGEAELLYIRSLSIVEILLGPEHLTTSVILNNLALLYEAQGAYEEAESFYVRSLPILEKQLISEHPKIADSLNNLATLYYAQGRYGESLMLQERSLMIREKQLGSDHHLVALSLNNLALIYLSQDDYEKAEPLFERSLLIREEQLGPNHPDVATCLNNLASTYLSQDDYEKAEPLFERSLLIREEQLGPNHPDVAVILINLGELYKSQSRYTKAEKMYLNGIKILSQFSKISRIEHPHLQPCIQNFYRFIEQVLREKRQTELSKHPATQALLEQLQSSDTDVE